MMKRCRAGGEEEKEVGEEEKAAMEATAKRQSPSTHRGR